MMSDICKTPFGTYAPLYRDKGFLPLPLKGKECHEKGWPDADDQKRNYWIQKYPTYNIGIQAGSDFKDGTRLGFLDIDHDSYTNIGRVLLGNPKCIRFGKKGAVIPFRYSSDLKIPKHKKMPHKITLNKIKIDGQGVAELFFSNSYCAVPPSIHPDIEQPYRWEGASLLDIDFNQLPLIGE